MKPVERVMKMTLQPKAVQVLYHIKPGKHPYRDKPAAVVKGLTEHVKVHALQ